MTEKTKSLIIIAVANGLIAFGYALSIPFLTIYLTTQKHVAPGIIGIMLAAAMFTTAAASAISGEVSDNFGRKRVMVVSLFLRSLSMLAIAASIFFDAHYLITIAFHFAGSFLGAFFRPASNAWIADNTNSAERVKAFGYIRIGINLGWTLGPAMGGFLANISYSLGFFLTSITFFTAMIYLQLYIQDALKKVLHRKSHFIKMFAELKNANLSRLCFYNFLISIVSAQLVVGLSLHAVKCLNLTENAVGLLFSIQGMSVVLLQYQASKFIAKMRLSAALALGCFLYAIGYGSVGFALGFYTLIIGMVFAALGEMLVLPAGHSLASNIAPDNKRGRFLGLYVLSNQAGVSTGILLAGIMMQNLSPVYPPLPWLVIAAIACVAGAAFLNLKKWVTYEQDGLKPRRPMPITKPMAR